MGTCIDDCDRDILRRKSLGQQQMFHSGREEKQLEERKAMNKMPKMIAQLPAERIFRFYNLL